MRTILSKALQSYNLVGKDFRFEQPWHVYCGPIAQVELSQDNFIYTLSFRWLAQLCRQNGSCFWKVEYDIQTVELPFTATADITGPKMIITIGHSKLFRGEIFLKNRYLIFEDISKLV